MNFKIMLLAFLCLFSASIICNVTSPAVKAYEGWNPDGSRLIGSIDNVVGNGTIADGGDPVGGGWPN